VLDFLNNDVSKRDKDLESIKVVCPGCRSTATRSRSTVLSVAVAGIMTLAMIVLLFIFVSDPGMHALALLFFWEACFLSQRLLLRLRQPYLVRTPVDSVDIEGAKVLFAT